MPMQQLAGQPVTRCMGSGRRPAQLPTVPSWIPGHTVPLVWAPGAATIGDKQTSPFIYHTHTPALTLHVQGSPQRMQGTSTTMYNRRSSALVCYLHKTPPPASPSSLPPRHSAQPATPIHHPKVALALLKGSGWHLPTQPIAVSTDGHNHAVKFPRKLGGWEREGEVGHFRIGCCFSLGALKEENSSLIPICLRQVFVRDRPRSLTGHLSCR